MTFSKFSIGLLTIFSIFYTSQISAQIYEDCAKPNKLFVRVEQPPEFNGSLQEYFENGFRQYSGEYDGIVRVSILIDSAGSPCCLNIQDNHSFIDSKVLKELVNKMPIWSSPKQNNHSVSYAVFLELVFKGSAFTVKYINEKSPPLMPVNNRNTSNHPDIKKDKNTGSVWKLWNFDNSQVPSNLSRSIAEDDRGVLWFCTDRGIVRIANDNWKIYNGLNVPELSGKNNITWTTGLAVDKGRNVWVQSFDYIVRFDGKKWTKFDTTNSPLSSVRKIYVDKNGTIWFCSFKGLVKYDGQSWTTYSTSNSPLVSNNVSGVYVDRK